MIVIVTFYKSIVILQKCYECNFKCYSEAEMKTHAITRYQEKQGTIGFVKQQVIEKMKCLSCD